jgi:hypothetical protein
MKVLKLSILQLAYFYLLFATFCFPTSVGVVAQVEEHVPNICQALGSIPSTGGKKKF